MPTNLASCALLDLSLKVDYSRQLKTNLNVKFVPLWNIRHSYYILNTFQIKTVIQNHQKIHYKIQVSKCWTRWGWAVPWSGEALLASPEEAGDCADFCNIQVTTIEEIYDSWNNFPIVHFISHGKTRFQIISGVWAWLS